jgi:Uma2 family endonuclease
MTIKNPSSLRQPEPAWEIARLFPDQGFWSEGDYLEVNRRTNRLVELNDGDVEVLEMPTKFHQHIATYLYNALDAHAIAHGGGEVVIAPYPVRLWEGKIREPDVVFSLESHIARMGNDFADGADLVMEILSDDRRRELETKRQEYAQANISEYWIIDPVEYRIMVLKLDAGGYAVFGNFGRSDRASSSLVGGFSVSVDDMFTAAERRQR